MFCPVLLSIMFVPFKPSTIEQKFISVLHALSICHKYTFVNPVVVLLWQLNSSAGVPACATRLQILPELSLFSPVTTRP